MAFDKKNWQTDEIIYANDLNRIEEGIKELETRMDNGGAGGPAGPKGDKGDQGPEGPQGPVGPTGPKGLDGMDGERGYTGPKGDKGDPGVGLNMSGEVDLLSDIIAMTSAKEGDAWYCKEDGKLYLAIKDNPQTISDWMELYIRGEVGPQGPKGDKGDKGEKGEQGERGPKGEDGSGGDGNPRDIKGYGDSIIFARDLTPIPEGLTAHPVMYNIPFMAAMEDGTLIAGADARVTWGDEGEIHIAVAKSTDRGKTWSGHKVIMSPPPNGRCMDGAILIGKHPTTKKERIFVFAAWLSHRVQWENPPGGVGAANDTGHVVMTYSDDAGETWSQYKKITSLAMYQAAGNVVYAIGGVGNGMQLKDGKLAVGCQCVRTNHSPMRVQARLLYSSDFGENWTLSSGGPDVGTSENNICQLANGHLLMNARSATGNTTYARHIYTSSNLGTTWTASSTNVTIPDNICQASTISATYDGMHMLFTTNCETSPTTGHGAWARGNLILKVGNKFGTQFKRLAPVGLPETRTGYSSIAWNQGYINSNPMLGVAFNTRLKSWLDGSNYTGTGTPPREWDEIICYRDMTYILPAAVKTVMEMDYDGASVGAGTKIEVPITYGSGVSNNGAPGQNTPKITVIDGTAFISGRFHKTSWSLGDVLGTFNTSQFSLTEPKYCTSIGWAKDGSSVSQSHVITVGTDGKITISGHNLSNADTLFLPGQFLGAV